MITFEPNFLLLLYLITIYLIIGGIILIIGSVVWYGEKKEYYWDLGDTFIGILMLIIGLLVLFL